MKKTILAIALMSMSGVTLATGNHHGNNPSSYDGGSASAKVSSSSVAVAGSSGNGSAFTTTWGSQSAVGSVGTSSSANSCCSGLYKSGSAGVSGYTAASGESYSKTQVSGDAMAFSKTAGKSSADAAGSAQFDTKGYKAPEGNAFGGSSAQNSNLSFTGSFGTGGGVSYTSSGTESGFSAGAAALRLGGFNEAQTNATAFSNSYDNTNVNVDWGNGWAFGQDNTSGGAAAGSNASSGSKTSSN